MLGRIRRRAKGTLNRLTESGERKASGIQPVASTPKPSQSNLSSDASSSVVAPTQRALISPSTVGISTHQDPATLAPASTPGESTTWTGLKLLLDTLSASSDMYEPLKSAIGGLWNCVKTFEASIRWHKPFATGYSQLYQSEASADQDYDTLKSELNPVCQDISRVMGGNAPPLMTLSVASLTRGIEKETAVWTRNSNIEGYRKDNHDGIVNYLRLVLMLLHRLSSDMNTDMWKIMNEDVARHHLERLPYSSAATYRSSQSDSLGRSGCTPNTRLNVLQLLQAWAQDGVSERVYWLNGMAGTGKTTIAYTLCEWLQEEGKLAASFFCARQLPECRDVNRIMPSIAYQLSLFSLPFRYTISQVLALDPGVHNQPVSQQFETLISGPLRKIEHALPPDLVIVVDALDECVDSDGVNRMLSAFLGHAADLPVKLFVTSRPEPQILDHMEGELGKHLRSELHLHELERSIVQSDIRAYLTAELQGLKLNDTDLDKLAEQSGVLFVYASTIVRYVKAGGVSSSSARLKMILSTRSDELEAGITAIDHLYSSILSSVFDSDSLEDMDRDLMRAVLHAVICAQEPLSVNAISGLLDMVTVDEIYFCLRPLSSVLQVSSTIGLVTTLHGSFPSYLLSEPRSREFYCDPQQRHVWYARRCFEIIKTQDPPFNICHLESSCLPDREVPDLEKRTEKAIPQHLFYACRYWEAHTAHIWRREEIVSEVLDFLSTKLLLWMEVMNLKQDIYAVVRVLSRLHSMLSRAESSPEIRGLALDAWRFAFAFASSPMTQFTPHIYISALALWPKDRPVSIYYSKTMTGLVKAAGTVMERRDKELLITSNSPQEINCVAYSPDGEHIVSGSKDGLIQLWDAHAGQVLGQPLEGHTELVFSVAYSPDGAYIVSGSLDTTVRIWDRSTRRMVNQALEGHGDVVYSVAYSPDGEHITSGSWDGTVRIWNAHTHSMKGQPLEGHTSRVGSVTYSPDGQHIASGSWDGTIRIWDAHTAQALERPLNAHTECVFSVRFSPDGSRIVSCSSDNTIRVWDTQTRKMVGQPLVGHTAVVYSVAYSPDGTRIVSGSFDRTIRIWDAQTGQMIGRPLEGHKDSVNSVAYSPDGLRIISGSSDKTIRIWDAHAEPVLDDQTQGRRDSIYQAAHQDMDSVSSHLKDMTQNYDPGDGDSRSSLPSVNSDPLGEIHIVRSLRGADQLTLAIWFDALHHLGTHLSNSWTLNEGGWVVGPDLARLLWVPHELRDTLMRPPHAFMITTNNSWRLDFTDANLGEEWHKCYSPIYVQSHGK